MAQMLGLLELQKQEGTVRSSSMKENEIWMLGCYLRCLKKVASVKNRLRKY